MNQAMPAHPTKSKRLLHKSSSGIAGSVLQSKYHDMFSHTFDSNRVSQLGNYSASEVLFAFCLYCCLN